MPFDSILCASEFSAACRKALELAIVMGQEADARLILLHALQLTDRIRASHRFHFQCPRESTLPSFARMRWQD